MKKKSVLNTAPVFRQQLSPLKALPLKHDFSLSSQPTKANKQTWLRLLLLKQQCTKCILPYLLQSNLTNTQNYSQHFIFSGRYNCTLLARVVHNTRIKRVAGDKSSSLLDPFTTHKWAILARVLHNTRMKRLSGDKHSCLSDLFVRYEEKVLLI